MSNFETLMLVVVWICFGLAILASVFRPRDTWIWLCDVFRAMVRVVEIYGEAFDRLFKSVGKLSPFERYVVPPALNNEELALRIAYSWFLDDLSKLDPMESCEEAVKKLEVAIQNALEGKPLLPISPFEQPFMTESLER